MSRIGEELQEALVRGIRDYGHLAVGFLLIGLPITFYVVIVGITVTTAVPTMLSLFGILSGAVLYRRHRSPGDPMAVNQAAHSSRSAPPSPAWASAPPSPARQARPTSPASTTATR